MQLTALQLRTILIFTDRNIIYQVQQRQMDGFGGCFFNHDDIRILTHWGRVTHICVSRLTITGSDNGLSPGRRQLSHYLNQCWNIVNWTLRNKLQWQFNRNANILIHENAIERVVCKMASILSRPQCVKSYPHYWPIVRSILQRSHEVILICQGSVV